MPISASSEVAVRKGRRFLTGLVAAWLGCVSPGVARAQPMPRSNWTSTDAPCARYDDLRRLVLGDIGVKIDAVEPWANEFRRALGFWNTVLAANFHEEANLDSYAVRIVNAGHDTLMNGIVARSQLTAWDNFRGKIAVSPRAAKTMSSAEMYGTAVHELGHMLGLKHNASSLSVMYFLNVNGTEILDAKDILDLSALHQLRVPSKPTIEQVEALTSRATKAN